MERVTLPGGVELIIDPGRRLARVHLDRPEVRNAQTMATWASLAEAADRIRADPGLSVVVLSGAGDDFSAGLDLRMLRGHAPAGEGDLRQRLTEDDAGVREAIAVFQDGFSCWRELPAIVIAVVTGHAIGAGFQLALAADLRILSEDAVLVMAEARLGLVPDLGGTQRLVEMVGHAHALEICATAAPVDARRAERLGLANTVVPADQLEEVVDRYLDALLAVDPEVSRTVKALVSGATRASPAEQRAAERAAQVPLLRRITGSSG